MWLTGLVARGMWDLPGPGLESMSLALAGGFLTTAPPRKPHPFTFNLYFSLYLKWVSGTSLVVQWLRIRLPMQGAWVRALVGELRSHMLWGN